MHGKLVYSPHTYGPSVFLQPFFGDDDFPANLPAILDAQYGYLAQAGHPLLVGEWGGRYDDGLDVTWQQAFKKYLEEHRIGSFYWA